MKIKTLDLLPVAIVDNTFAIGAENTSITADTSDIGYQSKFWIMAPSGYDPASGRCSNDTTIKIPMEPENKLRMDCSLAHCEYRHPVGSNATFPAVPIGQGLASPVRWLGTGAESGDHTPTYQLGWNLEQVELPIRVKTMKRRTVKVAVWPMRLNGAPNVALSEGLKSTIRTKLDQIIAYQTNAWFDVDFKNGEEADYLDGTEVVPVGDEMNIVTQYTLATGTKEKAMLSAFNDSNADIKIYLTDGVSYRLPVGTVQAGLSGYSYPSQDPTSGVYENSCIVETDGHNNDDIADSLVHEVGHILVGGGHPDQNGGAAPLPSLASDHIKRLMHSDVGHPGLLVKSEWDKAEKWLSNRTNGDN